MAPDRNAKLAEIYRRGDVLRTARRRRFLGASGAVALATVGALIALGLGLDGGVDGGHTNVAATGNPISPPVGLDPEPGEPAPLDPVAPSTSEAPSETPTSAVPEATTTTAGSSPTTVGPGTTIRPAGTSTTRGLVCRNSTDPRCGPFRYDPVPRNEPTSLRATPSATTVPVGTSVQLQVLAVDPDSPIAPSGCGDGVDWADPTAGPRPQCSASCMAQEPRYGPWDPPPPTPGRYEVAPGYIYSQPGTYDVTVAVSTGQCYLGPYDDDASTTVRITVTAA